MSKISWEQQGRSHQWYGYVQGEWRFEISKPVGGGNSLLLFGIDRAAGAHIVLTTGYYGKASLVKDAEAFAHLTKDDIAHISKLRRDNQTVMYDCRDALERHRMDSGTNAELAQKKLDTFIKDMKDNGYNIPGMTIAPIRRPISEDKEAEDRIKAEYSVKQDAIAAELRELTDGKVRV